MKIGIKFSYTKDIQVSPFKHSKKYSEKILSFSISSIIFTLKIRLYA